MKSAFLASIILLALALVSRADSNAIAGSWTVDYLSGLEMKTIGGADFDFKTDGNNLTGTASVGYGWPGKAPVSNGKVDGERISFTVFGRQASSDGYPRMDFVGTIHGDEVKLTMTFYPGGQHMSGRTEFQGKRVTG